MAYLIPKAKKNLHQCDYHLNHMKQSHNIEELETNFAAFVTSARSVTFILHKEFGKNEKFIEWYGNKNDPKKGTKIYEMRKDPLCNFFLNLRNKIEKEGIFGIKAISTQIKSFNSTTDIVDKPEGMSALVMGTNGIFISVYPNTPKADLLPANTKGEISTVFALENVPSMHLGKSIRNTNFFEVSKLYYEYLKRLVEDFTAIINK